MSNPHHRSYAFVLALNLILTSVIAQQKPADEKTDVIRISTELVQSQVTVLDKKGQLVTGLRPEQFELQVDGKTQRISFFEEVTAGGQLDRPLAATDPGNRPPAERDKPPTAPDQPLAQRRTVFFFLDDLHLSAASMKRTQDALQHFVTEIMHDSDQVAITTASAQLGFLQQLTNDKTVLRQAIEGLKTRAVDYTDMQSPSMTEYQAWAIEQNHSDVREIFVERTCTEVLRVGPKECADAGMTNNAVLDEVNTRSDRRGSSGGGLSSSNRSGPNGTAAGNQARWRAENIVKSRARTITRQSAQGILGTLSSLESLIRTAAYLPQRKLVVFVSDGFFVNFASSTQVYDLKRITDLATRYGTVIYTIDARGLNSGLTDASKFGSFDLSGRMARVNLPETRAGQEPLFNLAAETGGESWLNSNSIDAGIIKAFNETSKYYLLAWRPDNQAQTTDSFRKVKITVKGQPELVVRVAGGFFTRAPESKTNSDAALSVDDQLLAALRESNPRPDIPIIVSAGYLNSATDGLVLAASVQLATDSDLDLMGAVVDDKGKILSTLKQQVILPVGNGNSVTTTLQFPKLSTGLLQVRIAARNSKSGRIGSAVQWIELPDLSQKLSASSVFLSESALDSQGGASKWIIKPERKFARTGKLRFQVFVYNADHSAGAPAVQLQIELRREGQVLVQTPGSPIDTKGVTDLDRIPVAGDFPLAGFQPGRYALKLILTDQKTRSSVSRDVEFTVL
jgi:VWFA-related protein